MLEKKIYIKTGGTTSSRDMGNRIPPYYPNFNISDWYTGRESFFYNLYNSSQVFIQYGKNQEGWASARFFSQSVEILNEVEQDNGDIKADIKIIPKYFKGFKNSLSVTGYNVVYKIYIGNQLIYSFNGQTTDEINYGEREPIYKSVTIKPQENYTGSAFNLNIHYPNGEFSDADLIVGMALFNPNPLTYIPMSTRKNNLWKSLNKNNGKIQKRVGGVWVDKSQENINTSLQENKGKNRIRKNNLWKQLPPIN